MMDLECVCVWQGGSRCRMQVQRWASLSRSKWTGQLSSRTRGEVGAGLRRTPPPAELISIATHNTNLHLKAAIMFRRVCRTPVNLPRVLLHSCHGQSYSYQWHSYEYWL